MTKATQDPVEHQEHDSHEDDLIVVPKGRSRLLFFFTLAIMLFVLFIFTVGDDVVTSLSGQRQKGSDVFMRWRTPQGGEQELSGTDFMLQKRALAPLRGNDVTDDAVANWIVLDHLAQESGIAVTDAELSDRILAMFGSAAAYDQFIRSRRGMTTKEFEATVRGEMRVARYAGMITSSARPFDPAEVERRWKGRHQEYRFEYVSQAVADMQDAARADVPEDAELEAFYNAMYDYKKQEYKRPAQVRGEVAFLSLEGTPDEVAARAQKLLEAYPGEEVTDPAERAEQYYYDFRHARFRLEKPDLSNVDPARGFSPDDFTMPFAEVEERALVEAPLYDALLAWNTSLNQRLDGGETVDLAREAEELGLQYFVPDELMTVDAWEEAYPDFGNVASDQFALTVEAGTFTPAPVVDEATLSVGRLLDKVEARQPEFAEIRDEVAESWVAEHAQQLASEKLDALRDELGERPAPPTPFRPEATSEKFREVAAAAGYEVEVHDWHDRFDRPEEPTPAEQFFQAGTQLYTQREDSVGAPGFDRAKETAFLARVDGIRDPEVKDLDPNEIQGLQRSAEQEALTDFATRTFGSRAYMQERYDLWVRSWEPDDAEGASEGP